MLRGVEALRRRVRERVLLEAEAHLDLGRDPRDEQRQRRGRQPRRGRLPRGPSLPRSPHAPGGILPRRLAAHAETGTVPDS